MVHGRAGRPRIVHRIVKGQGQGEGREQRGRGSHLDEFPEEKRPFGGRFPYVCPEPVLVKCSFLCINGSKRPLLPTILYQRAAVDPHLAEQGQLAQPPPPHLRTYHKALTAPRRPIHPRYRCQLLPTTTPVLPLPPQIHSRLKSNMLSIRGKFQCRDMICLCNAM
jgi:hypothetical protein